MSLDASDDAVRHAIAEIITDLASNEEGVGADDYNTPIVDLGVSSLALIRFVTAIEERFAIQFPLEMMSADRFLTVAEAANTVCECSRQMCQESE